MSVIQFNPSNKDPEIPVEELQPNKPDIHLLQKKVTSSDLSEKMEKSVNRQPIKFDTRSKTDKIIDKALIIATLVGLVAIIWYLHETLGIDDITTANIPEIMDKLSAIEPNILLDNTLSKIGRLR